MLFAVHLLVVLLAMFTGKLWIASSWTVLLLAYVAALAIHLKQPYWRTWTTGLGTLAALYAAYTVSYLNLDFSTTWSFADHMRFVGWTGPLALLDAPIVLFAVVKGHESQVKKTLHERHDPFGTSDG